MMMVLRFHSNAGGVVLADHFLLTAYTLSYPVSTSSKLCHNPQEMERITKDDIRLIKTIFSSA